METQHTLQSNNGVCLTATLPVGTCLTTRPDDFFIGDPPAGLPFPGTTHFDIVSQKPTPFAGDGVCQPSGLWPTVAWPNTLGPFQVTQGFLNPGVGSLTVPTGWTFSVLGDRCTARVDMPGVKAADLMIDIDNGTIKATGKRFDTNVPVMTQQFIGSDFDPKTAEAVLEAGVLTVTVLKFKEKLVHRVPVAEK
jgi:hypothetical protein